MFIAEIKRIFRAVFGGEDFLHKSANERLKSLKKLIELGDFSHLPEHHNFVPIIKDDPNSPKVMYLTSDKQSLLVWYPKQSSTYPNPTEQDKYVVVIEGDLYYYDKEGNENKAKRRLIYKAGDQIFPFSKDEECIVYVHFKRPSIWNNIC